MKRSEDVVLNGERERETKKNKGQRLVEILGVKDIYKIVF